MRISAKDEPGTYFRFKVLFNLSHVGFLVEYSKKFYPKFFFILGIDRYGITFPHKKLELIWLWPWRRTEGVFLDTVIWTEFKTLKDLDKWWDKCAQVSAESGYYQHYANQLIEERNELRTDKTDVA